MKTTSKFIATLSDETIEAANLIHRYYIFDGGSDIGDSIDANMELHDLLIRSIEEFVMDERIAEVNETYNGDHIEVFLVAVGDGFVPSVRTNHIDAPASTIDPELAVPSVAQAMAWGFGDAVINHILEQGIIG
jgi:hypothetical protein